MGYTLASLQTRRSAALEGGDMAAYWAFDLLIGHVLGEPEMYARQNQVLVERMAVTPYLQTDDPYSIHEERRKHP